MYKNANFNILHGRYVRVNLKLYSSVKWVNNPDHFRAYGSGSLLKSTEM